jgi:hypothetical protein
VTSKVNNAKYKEKDVIEKKKISTWLMVDIA